MKRPSAGGGWQAIRYAWTTSRRVGGVRKMVRSLRTKNACKTCALGMGGQRGGMVNEGGRWPEVCKKSIQAMAADMQSAISPGFWDTYSIQQLKRFSPRELEACGRLVEPLIHRRGDTHFRTMSWSEALGRVVERLKQIKPDQTFWYFSGRSSNEAGFLLQLFARLYGTNNVNNCSYYCHQASGVGLASSVGSGTATIVLKDLEKADLVFLIGGNPASNHPRLMTSLMHVRRRGGKVIVVNPVVETGLVRFRIPSDVRSLLFGSEIASLYIQPHIGGDLALLAGIAKRIDELGMADGGFMERHCVGADQWLSSIRSLSWSEIAARSGVEQAEIERIGDCYGQADNTIFSWTMGITHHQHGVQNVQAIANLALMRGMVGRPGAGLMPIRGHSNVQGIGSVGVTPKLKDAIFERLESELDVTLPRSPGLDTLACMEAAHQKKLALGFCLGGNLYGSNPDSRFAAESLGRLETVVYLNTTLNTGHVHGLADETLILPVLARDEEPQPTTQESMFNYVRLSDGGPSRLDGPRSEVEVIAELGQQVLGDRDPIDWQLMRDTGKIRRAMALVIPGFEKIEEIDETKSEFQIGGRTFHEPRFPTADGRARFHAHQLPELSGGERQLRLMTVRSEGQFNTVVYEDHDLYRGQDSRDVILVHPDDIERLGLMPNERYTVSNQTGQMVGIQVKSYTDIKPGNALMYYPEANVLVPRSADEQSKTPAFKGALVEIERPA